MADMWVDGDQDPRTEGNPQGEKATYVEYLRNYRLTLGMKCDGLTPEQLGACALVTDALEQLTEAERHEAEGGLELSSIERAFLEKRPPVFKST